MADEPESDRMTTQDAVNSILKYYHIRPVELPDSIKDRDEQIEYMMQPHGIMNRRVKLRSGWHRDAVGAMLGTRREDGKAVALIPRKTSGYFFLDPHTGKKERVTAQTEALFEEEALLFYNPFPMRRLTVRDLTRQMFHTLSSWDMAMILMATGLVTLIGMLLPGINKLIFGVVLQSGSVRVLGAIACFLLSVMVSQAILEVMRTLILNKIALKMDVAVEAATMMRVLSLPPAFFKKYSSGELAQRIEYVNSLCDALSDLTMSSAMSAVFSLIYIVQIFKYTPALFVPALMILLITVAFSVISALVQAGVSRKTMDISSRESGTVYSIISGIQKIKVAGAEKRAFSRWAAEYAQEASLTYDPPMIIKVNTVITTAISLAGTIAIYICAVANGVAVSDYFAFNTAYGMASGAFVSLAGVTLSAANIRPILQIAEPIFNEVPEAAGNKKMVKKLSGNIEISHVSFRYTDTMPLIFDDLSLSIRSGEYVAVVGDTGCGKSTLVRLLLGFERQQKGSVSFDGKDINTLDLRSLRNRTGVVMQNGKIFQGDIFSNISISAPSLTLDEAWEAAEIAGLADDIREMPMGMRTVISEGTGGISGGQKQRLMIARAVAPKPKILIFDEATSALDNVTQKKVSEALDSLKCTRIIIAHRLSTIRQCDRVIFLRDGKIAEDGTYESLIEKNGLFAELVERQRVDAGDDR